MRDDAGVHLTHCYQGEYPNTCKYGDEDCPAKPKDGEGEFDHPFEAILYSNACHKCKKPHPQPPRELRLFGSIRGVEYPVILQQDFRTLPHPIDTPRIEVAFRVCFTGTTMRETDNLIEKISEQFRMWLNYDKPESEGE